MIIKVRDGNNWVLFDEVDSLRYHVEGEGFVMTDATLNFLGEDSASPLPESLGSGGNRWSLLFMNKNMTEETHVLANSPIYLMNNDGKTIERL